MVADSSPAPVQLDLHGAHVVVGAPITGTGIVVIQAAAAGRRLAVISDSNVSPLHARPLANTLGASADACFDVPSGEASKSRAEWARLTDAMLARGFGRDSVIVAVGGGVVCDLAGFVAATYMRGVPVIQVPTSLLAMIDAAIGGKTGVDTGAGKNLVGAFHQPLLVVADPLTLATLPAEHLRNGLAEALKHAVITGAAELEWLLAHAAAITRTGGPDEAVARQLVERNVRIKADIVARDEREGGVRKTLNFGHTIGHAIEAVAGYTILHGECVAIGMRVEGMIAQALGLADASLVARIDVALTALALPSRPPRAMDPAAVLAATRTDKKARGGVVEYALMRAVGTPAGDAAGYGTPVADPVVLDALTRAFSA